MGINESEEHSAVLFMAGKPWITVKRQAVVPPKLWYPSTKTDGVTPKNALRLTYACFMRNVWNRWIENLRQMSNHSYTWFTWQSFL